MTAPDEPSSRAASSTTSWRSSAGSWMVIRRRAISRSARSPSAVRSSARLRRREPVDEARVGDARSRPARPGRRCSRRASSPKASRSRDARPGARPAGRPRRRPAPRSPSAGRPPARPVALGVVLEPLVAHVVARSPPAGLRGRQAGQADRLLVAGGDVERPSRVGERAVSPGRSRATAPGQRLEEVQPRPLAAQQPGGLVDDAQQEVARVARRSSPAGCRSRAACAPPRRAWRAPRAIAPAPRSAARDRARPPTGRRWSRAGRRRSGAEGVDRASTTP